MNIKYDKILKRLRESDVDKETLEDISVILAESSVDTANSEIILNEILSQIKITNELLQIMISPK